MGIVTFETPHVTTSAVLYISLISLLTGEPGGSNVLEKAIGVQIDGITIPAARA
jgi:hypothetical protein